MASQALNNIATFIFKNQPVIPAILLSVLLCSVVNPIHIIEWLLTYILHPVLNLIGQLLLPLSALLIAGVFSCPSKESFSFWLIEMIHSVIQYKESPYLETYLKMEKMEMVPYFFHIGFCKIAVCNLEGDKKIIFLGIFNTWFRLTSF